MKPTRLFYLLLFLDSSALLGYGYYLQFVDGLDPCPLCIFQRFAYMGIIFFAFIATLHGPEKTAARVYDVFLVLCSVIGVAIAGRQVWLQHLPPDKVPECGPGLDYMLQVFSLGETLDKVFRGSGECAVVDWTFLSLSIAEWSLLCFSAFSAILLIHLIRGRVCAWF